MDMDKVSKWMAILGVFVLGLLCWLSPPFGNDGDDRRAFMIECQNDGMKHYYCVSLWNGGGIPVFRSRDLIPLDMN